MQYPRSVRPLAAAGLGLALLLSTTAPAFAHHGHARQLSSGEICSKGNEIVRAIDRLTFGQGNERQETLKQVRKAVFTTVGTSGFSLRKVLAGIVVPIGGGADQSLITFLTNKGAFGSGGPLEACA